MTFVNCIFCWALWIINRLKKGIVVSLKFFPLMILIIEAAPWSTINIVRVNHCSSSCSTQRRVLPKRVRNSVGVNNPYADYLILLGVPICLAEFSAGQIGTRRTQEGSDSHAKTLLLPSLLLLPFRRCHLYRLSLPIYILSNSHSPDNASRKWVCAVYRCRR
jgi:hypothetical protein